jgi:hypothetical protein
MNKNTAYSYALALESASGLPFNHSTGEYILTEDALEKYARCVAYKVAHNIKKGSSMDPTLDPTHYFEYGEKE